MKKTCHRSMNVQNTVSTFMRVDRLCRFIFIFEALKIYNLSQNLRYFLIYWGKEESFHL